MRLLLGVLKAFYEIHQLEDSVNERERPLQAGKVCEPTFSGCVWGIFWWKNMSSSAFPCLAIVWSSGVERIPKLMGPCLLWRKPIKCETVSVVGSSIHVGFTFCFFLQLNTTIRHLGMTSAGATSQREAGHDGVPAQIGPVTWGNHCVQRCIGRVWQRGHWIIGSRRFFSSST